MSFHLGKPIFVLLVLSLASGAAMFMRKTPPRADLVVWCFADSHAKTYRQPPLLQQFQAMTGKTVQIDLIGQQAEDVRLVSLFMSRATGNEVPDLCEIEIGSIGKFFRPPVDEVGLLPLNSYLKSSGQMDRILASRFAPWSKKDLRTGENIIFGVPNDVHPMTITYRKDLFDEAGIDPSQIKTWPEFQSLCLELQRYRAAHGHPESHAIELPATSSDVLVSMLLQRHVNVIDNANQVHLTDPKVVRTVAFYVQLVAGPGRIGGDVSSAAGFGTQDLESGEVCALTTPDWKAGYVKQYAPDLAGKLRMMPLPRFDPDDAPTSTSGGTMMGIPRACQQPEMAWKLLEQLYLSPAANTARLAAGEGILPPIPSLWNDPVYHQSDPFYGGQKVYELYVRLAPQIPQRFVTPYTAQGGVALSLVLYKAEGYLQSHGNAGLEQACANWLAQAQTQLQQRIDFGKFEQ